MTGAEDICFFIKVGSYKNNIVLMSTSIELYITGSITIIELNSRTFE